MKRIVRLTEADLTRLVKRVIKEQSVIKQLKDKSSSSADARGLSNAQPQLPLTSAQVQEFIRYAQVAKTEDRQGNGANSKNAINGADMTCKTHRGKMFKNGDWRQPVVADPEGVQAASQAINTIQTDLSGIGSPIGGLSQGALNKVKGLMSVGGSTEKDKYLQVQRICMLFNGYSETTKEYLAYDLAGDIEGDFGQQHDSWWMAGDSIFGLLTAR